MDCPPLTFLNLLNSRRVGPVRVGLPLPCAIGSDEPTKVPNPALAFYRLVQASKPDNKPSTNTTNPTPAEKCHLAPLSCRDCIRFVWLHARPPIPVPQTYIRLKLR